jgi:hypothetical protein
MKTIIINNQNEIVKGPFKKPYAELYTGTINEGLREVPYIDTPRPVIDAAIEKAINTGFHYDSETDSYRQVWEVVALSDYELAQRDWIYPDYEFRIVCPKQLGEQYPAMYVHFQMEELPIEKHPTDDNLRVIYINTILQQHSDLLQALQDVVDLDSRPSILNPEPEII